MILSSGHTMLPGEGPLVLALLATVSYLMAALRPGAPDRPFSAALVFGWLLHGVLLVLDIGGWGLPVPGARLGFAPVLSLTLWLVLTVHTVESRFVPVPAVRRVLAAAGAVAVPLAWAFPGAPHPPGSPWGPLHFTLGVGSYALFAAAVLHGLLLDAAERRLRLRTGAPPRTFGMPLLQLERLTFRFVEAGFVVLTLAVLLGVATTTAWRWDHKTVFSLLGWAVFAGLLLGRALRGWRGRLATRWLYVGAVLLLLAYAGSRFVMEVLLVRAA